MELIYGTGNPAKVQVMKRSLAGLPIKLLSLTEAAEKYHVALPEVEENGTTPLENAALKAHTYYECFRRPVFSCDSGLYLWEAESGVPLPEKEQPGIHVRGRGKERLSDEELLFRYTGLVKKYGRILARYKNGICFVKDREHIYESMEEALWGDAFFLTDVPHKRRVPGFPLDSISLDIRTGKYYYDLEGEAQDDVAAERGFGQFFAKYLEDADLRGE